MDNPIDIYRTLVLFKPDAVARRLVGPCLARFEQRGLKILGIKSVWPEPEKLAEHYAEHAGREYYTELVTRMAGRHTLACVLRGPNAVKSARSLVGPCFDAPAGTIRGDFGFSRSVENLIHTSDGLESADREIEIWFSDDELDLGEV